MENKSDEKYDLVVACIGNNELDESLLNTAYKKARFSSCPWRVLTIVKSKPAPYSQSKVQRLFKKAAVLKAEIVQYDSENVSNGIVGYARSLNTEGKKILFLVGTHKISHYLNVFRRTIFNKVRGSLKSFGIETKVVLRERDYVKNYTFISPIFNFDALAGIVEALLCVSLAFIVSYFQNFLFPIKTEISNSNVYLIYLFACVIPSIRGGFIPGLLATVLSVAAIHFFFLQPVLHFRTYNPGDLYNLGVFFVCGTILSLIGSGTRRYIIEAKQKEAYLNALLNVSETLNRPLTETEALTYIHHELEKLFATDVAIFTPGFIDLNSLRLACPEKMEDFNEEETQAFNICHSDYRSTGFLTSTYPESKWYFEPMMCPEGFQGVLAVKLANSPLRYEPNVISILLGFSDLSATIIDRIEHTQTLEENRITQEKEKLRTMLLSSVSHDLKTPLASIIGSLDVYHSLGKKLPLKDRKALLSTSLQEAQRLDSFITNILDMAKLESGSIKFKKEWQPIKPLIDKAIDLAKTKLGNRQKKIIGQDHEVEIDYNMMLRAVSNLLDNISKYTPPESAYSIKYGVDEEGKFSIYINDSGPGIDENMLDAIFNKYTRIKQLDNKIAGTGLGLPISKYIIEEHEANIVAYNNDNGIGSTFKISFPRYR